SIGSKEVNLSEDHPRFSQGNEPPLNLTEKVNRVEMDRMRAAKNNQKEEPHDVHKPGESKRKRHTRKGKVSEKPTKSVPEITVRHAAEEISNQAAGSEKLKKDASNQSESRREPLRVQSPPELVETTEQRGTRATDQ